MNMWRGFIWSWVVILGYIVVVILIGAVQVWLAEAGLVTYIQSLPFYLCFNVVALGATFMILWRLFSPRALRQARERGLPATGRVLALQPTGWRHRRRWYSSKPRQRQYAIRLEISRPAEPAYEATVLEFLPAGAVPEVGQTLAVKVHPERPHVVVLAQDLSAQPAL
jgi:hypothetical protein